MFVNSDFSDLLRLFKSNGVKYLVLAVTQLSNTPNPVLPKTWTSE